MSSPAISVVTAARNDNYGGRLIERIRAHATSVDGFAAGLGADVEHVVVEWNPPRSRPTLSESLPAPRSQRVARRYILARGSEVQAVCEQEKRRFVEGVAKNVAIRRAHGEMVLITNSDDILTFELGVAVAQWLPSGRGGGLFARCDRLDVSFDPEEAIPAEIGLADALARVVALHSRGVSHRCADRDVAELPALASQPQELDSRFGGWFLSANHPGDPTSWLHTNASGDALFVSRETLHEAGGFCESLRISTHLDSLLLGRLYGLGVRQAIFQFPSVVLHVDHERVPGYGTGSTPWREMEGIFRELCAGGVNPGQPGDWGMATSGFTELVQRGVR